MENLEEISKRSQKYWYDDGIAELVVGGLFVLLGAYFWLQNALESGSTLGSMLTTMLVVAVIGSGFLGRGLIRALKARLTYPRTGYVAVKAPRRSRLRGILLGVFCLALAVALSSLFAGQAQLQRWIPVASGVFVGLIWTTFGVRTGILRFYVVGVLTVLLGAVIAWLNLSLASGLIAFYGLTGLMMAVSGALTLIRYLNTSEAPDGDGE